MSSDKSRRGDVVLFHDQLFMIEEETAGRMKLTPVEKLTTDRGYKKRGRSRWFKLSPVIAIESINPKSLR